MANLYTSVVDLMLQHVKVNKTDDIFINIDRIYDDIKNNLLAQQCYNFVEYGTNTISKLSFENLDISRLQDVSSQHTLHMIGIPDIDAKRSIASMRYIQKCAQYAHSMTMILPKAYKKDIYKSMFPLSFQLVFEDDFQNDYIRLKGKCRFIPSVIQIWVRK